MTFNECRIMKHIQKLNLEKPMLFFSEPFNTKTFIVIVSILYMYKLLNNTDIIIILFGGLFSIILKLIFRRTRPYQKCNIVRNNSPKYHETLFDKYSFPSGHTFMSTLFTAIMLNKFPNEFMFNIIPILVGFSRIFLGVHYPTDIVGGIIFGYLYFHIINSK